MDPFADNNHKEEENSFESEKLDFNSTQMTLKDEIEEEKDDYGIYEEFAETNIAGDAVPVPSERTELQFSTATTMILLHEYRKRIDKFCDKTINASLIWDEIVNEFNKMNYDTTGDQLSEKFGNLKKFYLDVKDSGTVTWEFFKTFSEITKAEEENVPSENFTDDQELINKPAVSPTNVEIQNLSEINCKFKNTTTLKRKRGRPPKISSSIRYQDVKMFEIKKENKMSPSAEVNHEMPPAMQNVKSELKIHKSKWSRLPIAKFKIINNKFMKMNEKRQRGRPSKIKRSSVYDRDVKVFANNQNYSSTNLVTIPSYPVNNEIPVSNSVQQEIMSTDKDKEISIAPGKVSPSILKQEVPTAITDMNDKLIKTKRARFSDLKFSGRKYKFKKEMILTRKRGRPPKNKILPINGQEIKVENNMDNDTFNSTIKGNLAPNPVNKKIQVAISNVNNKKRASLPTLKFPGINYNIKKMIFKGKRGRPPKIKRLLKDGQDVSFFKNKTNNSTNLVAHSTYPVNIEIPQPNSAQPKILAINKDNETDKNNETEKDKEMCISPGIVSPSLVSPQLMVAIPNMNDELKKNNNKGIVLTTSKFSGMDYKFKMSMPFKRTRGRPKKHLPKDAQDVNVFRNKTSNSTDLLAQSTYPVNIEIPQTDSTQQRIPSTDQDNERENDNETGNDNKTENDKEMCIAPSLVSQEIPAAIPNMNDELIENNNEREPKPNSKFSGTNYKFQKAMPLKRTRGRPPKIKRLRKIGQKFNVFENKNFNSTDLLDHSKYPVNIEIAQLNPTQQTNKDIETENDKDLCIVPGIVSPSLVSQEIPAAIPNMNDELIKNNNKSFGLPTSKSSGINYKFKMVIPLKRTRGRPPKMKRLRKVGQNINVVENKSSTSTDLLAHSNYPVSIEIADLNPTQQSIPSTNTQNINASKMFKDNERCIARSPTPVNKEIIQLAIPNVSVELNEFQRRLLLIEEQKRDELRKLRLALEENTRLLDRMCEKFLNAQ